MDIRTENLNHPAIHHLLTNTIVPRPIAWVLSQGEQEPFLLSPISYFTPICSAPPTLVLALAQKEQPNPRDTLSNIEANQHFVIHIGRARQGYSTQSGALSFAPDEAELDFMQDQLHPFADFSLPRLAEFPVALGCQFKQSVAIGDRPQMAIFAEVTHAYIDDELIKDEDILTLDSLKIAAIARIGSDRFAKISQAFEEGDHLDGAD